MKKNVMHIFSAIGIAFVLTALLIPIAIAAQQEVPVSYQGTATVKAIDAGKGIVKLAHAPIPSLNWPAMTMNFKIKDHALIQGIKIDDAVTFAFIQSDGDYVITHLKPASE